ncbi:TetR/AcrR family transcriptional regulator [Pseudomonas sp. Q1-7]|uniref:TetR/AcrR family transcriptional regulator n=1 Tax=Pseudomonas sp. Q1-7 TaxID=3020843 RepID=UPI002300B51B|nr:TetR/AcrR family transcriptional regulator [Pseudomonas sp. Q1-7]
MGFTQTASAGASPCARREGPAASRFERNREKALALFACKGFGQVSLRELAAHLELTAGSLYHHCSSKEELLFEFIEEYYEGLLAVSSRVTPGKPCAEQLRDLAAALIELHRQQPLRFRLAAKERHCLTPAHQQRIAELELLCQERWLRQVGKGLHLSPSSRKAAGDALLNIFQQIPNWLEHAGLAEAERSAFLESLILGAVSQLVSFLKTASPVSTQGNAHAPVLRSAS